MAAFNLQRAASVKLTQLLPVHEIITFAAFCSSDSLPTSIRPTRDRVLCMNAVTSHHSAGQNLSFSEVGVQA